MTSDVDVARPTSTPIDVIDVDTHLIEPPDLWTSRLPRKFQDVAPQLVWDEKSQLQRWKVGRHLLAGEGGHAHAGWSEFYPSTPPTLAEADPAGFDPQERLKRMDEYGIRTQILYPNLLGFFGFAFLDLEDAELRLACVRAYNDFQTEWCSVDPLRLVPLTFLPWWDVDACIAELDRCADLGHRGVNWGLEFEKLGLPRLRDPHWDPVLSRAQEMGLPINFHIGFGSHTEEDLSNWQSFDNDLALAQDAVLFFLGNAKCITELVMSGMCARYPELKFVSVESGFGYIPYLVEAMDWQFRNNRASVRRPELLLPSEYFTRQIYATFWFERNIDRLIDLFPDNVMFESDFPHPTSLSPGAGSVAQDPKSYIADNLAAIPVDIQRKILHDNAAKVYNLA